VKKPEAPRGHFSLKELGLMLLVAMTIVLVASEGTDLSAITGRLTLMLPPALVLILVVWLIGRLRDRDR
jgi:F0F1-type ATP synthase assembly protein I